MSSQGQDYGPPQQGYPPPQQGYPPAGPPAREQQFIPDFNEDELRVLRECNIESFYYRALPLATALSTVAFFAMKGGVLKASAKYGYTPKVLGATLLGYAIGKFSYRHTCAEKLMSIPDSPIGEALRKRRGRMGFQETMGNEPGFSVALPTNESGPSHPRQPIFDDHRPDTHNEGLEEYERGVTDALTPYTEITPSSSQQSSSYDELRRQNREEYINRMAEKYRRPQSDAPLDSGLSNLPSDYLHTPPPPPPPRQFSPASRTVTKNEYGDEVYE